MPEPYIPPQGPPQCPPPHPGIFAAMGADGMTRMLEDVYRGLAASSIAGLFPTDPASLMAAAQKNALFFIQISGGPPMFSAQVGPPRMRARHMPFAISDASRLVWLSCWEPVLAQASQRYGFPTEHLQGFRRFLDEFSAWMVNQAP